LSRGLVIEPATTQRRARRLSNIDPECRVITRP
jgi:hypothetical protein